MIYCCLDVALKTVSLSLKSNLDWINFSVRNMAVNMAAAPTSWTTFYLKVHVPLIQLSFLTYFLLFYVKKTDQHGLSILNWPARRELSKSKYMYILLYWLNYYISIKINACTWFRRVFIVLPLSNVQYQNRNWIQISIFLLKEILWIRKIAIIEFSRT